MVRGPRVARRRPPAPPRHEAWPTVVFRPRAAWVSLWGLIYAAYPTFAVWAWQSGGRVQALLLAAALAGAAPFAFRYRIEFTATAIRQRYARRWRQIRYERLASKAESHVWAGYGTMRAVALLPKVGGDGDRLWLARYLFSRSQRTEMDRLLASRAPQAAGAAMARQAPGAPSVPGRLGR